MKVLKSTSDTNRNCEFANFEFVPKSGWKISQAFIDFNSGLLVVSESDQNEANWIDTGFGSRIIPNKKYLIDTKTGDILAPEQWMKYFSYETKETISEDRKYKLISTRVHDFEKHSDSIKEELIELISGRTLASSTGIAFREEKLENLLESHYREKKEQKERKAKLEALPNLTEFFEKEFKKLKKEDVILNYANSKFIFKLVYNGTSFELFRLRKNYRYGLKLGILKHTKIESFATIQDFASKFLNNKNWFLKHSPYNRSKDRAEPNKLLKKFFIEYFNMLREKHDFTFKEYEKIQRWENHFYEHDSIKRSEYKQFCANCKKPVYYNPRYPKYICNDCSSKMITDEDGLELSFSNVGISGGLSIIYKKDGEVIKKDTNTSKKLCFIDGKRFIAREARFGGIVIQTEK